MLNLWFWKKVQELLWKVIIKLGYKDNFKKIIYLQICNLFKKIKKSFEIKGNVNG